MLLATITVILQLGFALAIPTANSIGDPPRTELSERCATVCRICTNGPEVWDCCACGDCCKQGPGT